MNYKVNRTLAGTKAQKLARGQAQVAGGWRGFGLNQVHNIESSCCVMQSEDDRSDHEHDDYAPADRADPADKRETGAASVPARAIGPPIDNEPTSKKAGPRPVVNSSRISEASSKYRISDDGRHQEYRQQGRQPIDNGEDGPRSLDPSGRTSFPRRAGNRGQSEFAANNDLLAKIGMRKDLIGVATGAKARQHPNHASLLAEGPKLQRTDEKAQRRQRWNFTDSNTLENAP